MANLVDASNEAASQKWEIACLSLATESVTEKRDDDSVVFRVQKCCSYAVHIVY